MTRRPAALLTVGLLNAVLWGAAGSVAPSRAGEVPEAVRSAEQQRIAAIAKARVAAVAVFAPGGKGGGSGVVITPDGYCLTNFHVVQPCGMYMQCGMADGELYDAVLVGIDPVGDVALIKLVGREDFPTGVLSDSDQVRPGDWCFAIGNPFLLATDYQPTVTYGIVSGVHRYQYPAGTLLEYTDCIQTDASINPGNSGGPLFNADGDLIGINGRGSFEKRGRVNVGVGYAISINQIKNFLGQLRSGRILDHATLGATVATSSDGRVKVSNILETSDAYRRGLRHGDELLLFAGRSIGSVNEFKNVLGIVPQGWRVPIRFRRDQQILEASVRLTGVHTRDELIAKVTGPAAAPEQAPPPGDGDRDQKDAEGDGKHDSGKPPREKKPGDGENPDEKKERDEQKGRGGPKGPMPKRPGRLPPGPPGVHPDEPPLPPQIAALIKERRGFANYYFNELNRDRVWQKFQELGDCSSSNGLWLLEGTVTSGLATQGKVQVALDDTRVVAQFPRGPAILETKQDLDTQLDPPGSGGVLIALHLWRRLLISGPREFGEVIYQGTAPRDAGSPFLDLLAATHGAIESDLYFDPESGHLVAVEAFPEKRADPCELVLSDYREVDGRQLPHRILVRHADRTFAEIELTKVELRAAEK